MAYFRGFRGREKRCRCLFRSISICLKFRKFVTVKKKRRLSLNSTVDLVFSILEFLAIFQVPIENHYAKAGVTAEEVMPLLPDFDMWQHACAQVIFDTDPAPRSSKVGCPRKHRENWVLNQPTP